MTWRGPREGPMKLVLRSGISCRRAFSTGQRMAQSKFEYVRNFEQDDKVGSFYLSEIFYF